MASVKVVVHAKILDCVLKSLLQIAKQTGHRQSNMKLLSDASLLLDPSQQGDIYGIENWPRRPRTVLLLVDQVSLSLFRPLLFSTPTQEHLPVSAHDPLHFLPSLPPIPL